MDDLIDGEDPKEIEKRLELVSGTLEGAAISLQFLVDQMRDALTVAKVNLPNKIDRRRVERRRAWGGPGAPGGVERRKPFDERRGVGEDRRGGTASDRRSSDEPEDGRRRHEGEHDDSNDR